MSLKWQGARQWWSRDRIIARHLRDLGLSLGEGGCWNSLYGCYLFSQRCDVTRKTPYYEKPNIHLAINSDRVVAVTSNWEHRCKKTWDKHVGSSRPKSVWISKFGTNCVFYSFFNATIIFVKNFKTPCGNLTISTPFRGKFKFDSGGDNL